LVSVAEDKDWVWDAEPAMNFFKKIWITLFNKKLKLS
jgi:hypothetical protein